MVYRYKSFFNLPKEGEISKFLSDYKYNNNKLSNLRVESITEFCIFTFININ